MSPLRGGLDEQKVLKMQLITGECRERRMVKAALSENIWTRKNMKDGLWGG